MTKKNKLEKRMEERIDSHSTRRCCYNHLIPGTRHYKSLHEAETCIFNSTLRLVFELKPDLEILFAYIILNGPFHIIY